jgi:hypothetical protein
MYDDLRHLPGTHFSMSSPDPSFHVTWRGGSRFLLSGEVSDEPNTELDIGLPSGTLRVPLATHTRPEHAVARLRRSLPRDVLMVARPSESGMEVGLQEAVLPAAKPPRLRVFATDLTQRVRQLDDNKVEFLGSVGALGHLTILCDAKRVTLLVHAGESAGATAARVGSSVPHGYRSVVDGAQVTVWKDADFFRAAA